MKKVLLGIIVLSQITASLAQEKMGYFLPGDINYNKEIPAPDQFFHQALGEWHLTHDQVLNYMEEIARISDRAILKKGTAVVESSGIKYSEPVKFDSKPYISGWISEENLERIKGAPVVSVYSEGRGKVISYHEDMNFRGIWLGTHKLFANSIFFGEVIR